MKKLRAVIALALALVMSFSLFATAASAATAENHKAYSYYVSLGDSIAVGWGPQNYTNRGFVREDSAYPSIVADTLGVETFVPLARNGFRTVELRYMLEKDYTGDSYNFRFGKIDQETITTYRELFPQYVANADLITLGIGSNDCMNLAKVRMQDFLKANLTSTSQQKTLSSIVASENDTGSTIQSMLKLAKVAGLYSIACGIMVDAIWDGYISFVKNFDKIIADIYALNPDVDLVVVGVYNMLRNMALTDNDIIKVGRAFDGVMIAMNAYMQYGCQYHSKYTYVDVEDVELYPWTPIITSKEALDPSHETHPTLEGQKYMANQIIAALPSGDTVG